MKFLIYVLSLERNNFTLIIQLIMGSAESKREKNLQKEKAAAAEAKDLKKCNKLQSKFEETFGDVCSDEDYLKIYKAIIRNNKDVFWSAIVQNKSFCNIWIGDNIHAEQIHYQAFAQLVLKSIHEFTVGMQITASKERVCTRTDNWGDSIEHKFVYSLTIEWGHITITKKDIEDCLITRNVWSWRQVATVQDVVIIQYLIQFRKLWELYDYEEKYTRMFIPGNENPTYEQPPTSGRIATQEDIIEHYDDIEGDLPANIKKFVKRFQKLIEN